MALSNTAVPKYYGMFRDAVMRGEIPVNNEISLEMNRIDDLIANPGVYYDDQAIDGWIKYCEQELTLTDGSDLNLLDSFKLWGEMALSWFYFVERSVYEPNEDGHGGRYVKKMVKKRLVNKQFLIVGRGAAKSVYGACIQSFFQNVDTSTTHQITTAPTMKQAEEVMSLTPCSPPSPIGLDNGVSLSCCGCKFSASLPPFLESLNSTILTAFPL